MISIIYSCILIKNIDIKIFAQTTNLMVERRIFAQ